MKQEGPSVDAKPEAIAAALRRRPASTLPVILCFFTGQQPRAATPMPRDPAPPVGGRFGADFPEVLATAVALNPSIHDGAVMIGRTVAGEPYRIRGWSHRLHPPEAGATQANRGSAFNSCAAMSTVEGVDRLLLVARHETFLFRAGAVEQLDD